MELILCLIWALVFSFQWGKSEGKWGCFTALAALFLLGLIVSIFDG